MREVTVTALITVTVIPFNWIAALFATHQVFLVATNKWQNYNHNSLVWSGEPL
jgi:hypothetical protein